MKILKIIHGYPPIYNAGSEVYSQTICNELVKNNEIFVLTRQENDYQPDFIFRNEIRDYINFTYINVPRGKDGYNHDVINKNFEQYLTKITPDIAHIGHLNHLSSGIVSILSNFRIPIVYTLHDFWLMCPRGQFLQRNFDGKSIFQLCEKQIDSDCAEKCYSMYFSGIENEDTNNIEKYNISDKSYWTFWVAERMKHFRGLAEKIDLFISPSKYLMNRYIQDFNIPPSKILFLDYGFPTSYLKPVECKNTDTYTFGYIGTHIPAKGVNLLIDAFKKLSGRISLKIFGREQGQNTQALKNMAEGFDVEFCGEYVNQDIVNMVFSKIDCIVVPSIWAENSPLVIHEAQACKLPVISANIGGMAEYVQHKVNGLLFEHRNSQSLAEQMQWAVNNTEQMKLLGKKGYLYSENGDVPNIQDHCRRLMEIYIQLTTSQVPKGENA